MKKLIPFIFIIAIFVRCEDRSPEPVLVPDWLKPRLTELENSGNCSGCTVQRWTYNNEYIYHLYCSYWSCSDCEMFHYDGTPVDWEIIDPIDFNAQKSRPMKIWECGDEL